MINEFIISSNDYVKKDAKAFYHTKYMGYNNDGNPNYLNDLKNTYDNFSNNKLKNAVKELEEVLKIDLPEILNKLNVQKLTACVVPRAKDECTYRDTQLRFKITIQNTIKQLDDFDDGTNYIIRHTNTKTTHLQNYTNDKNPLPYVGITKDTCCMSNDISGKNILLIDDIYTKDINIDEDAIQALLDSGAKSVFFYAVGACKIQKV